MSVAIQMFLTSSADFTQQVTLERQLVTIRIRWNIRNDSGFMDFTDELGNTLYGVRLVKNWPLLRQMKGTIEFEGDFFILPAGDTDPGEITYQNLGNELLLLYYTPEEVEAWEDETGVY